MIEASLITKSTVISLEWYIALYRKKPKLTIIVTVIAFIIFVIIAGIITVNVEKSRQAEIQKNFNYVKQLQILNDTQTNLKNLTEFIESEKQKLVKSQKILDELKEQEKLLTPI